MTDINKINNQNRINQLGNTAASEALKRGGLSGEANFKKLLDEQLSENSKLRFSKHAMERFSQREIELTEKLLSDLDDAVSKAKKKGAKDIIIINTNYVFIVNVPNNKVITMMSGKEMKDNVFINIDSAVLI